MAWVLLATTAALVALVVALAVVLLRLRTRLLAVEAEVRAQVAPSDTQGLAQAQVDSRSVSVDENPTEYLITRIGASEVEPAPRVDATMFTDLLVKESAVQLASLAHGVRRALAPETRNRIRFHMRQEVKRSRKQRRAEMRVAHREWTARQRVAGAAEDAAEGTAA